MVGGGNRRDEGSFKMTNNNVFAALDNLRKKKKSDKEKGLGKSSKSGLKTAAGKSKEPEERPQVYWAPAPLTVKSWADVDDDDDYFATTAPPQAVWGGSDLNQTEKTMQPDPIEESESEDDLDEADDVEEEHEHELQVQEKPELVPIKPPEGSRAPKETERQLSKKERKKKEMAELEAILANFAVTPNEKTIDELPDATKEKKEGQLNGETEKKDSVPAESKNAKKKKKKDKASKEVKEPQEQPGSSNVSNGQEENAGTEQLEDDSSAVDMKERLKKVASAKKKKSSKDAAARAASVEAAARSAKLAAAKKKEKNHYNQQPTR
ncbi:unnamed protein product [Fraxinus pennsylvanica]|uniref:Uncharacterized protein n=1 Tax=Fraxinus pennsylvanica TaxID=56036 RepID=A0AAD2E151_9LAMI|nr:unnamed protein product [Fraxinus pennsylvanica]